jgi:hypothetical protein
MMEPGTKIIHEPTGRTGHVIAYSELIESMAGPDQHIQIQFEGTIYPSFVRLDEIKQMLLG